MHIGDKSEHCSGCGACVHICPRKAVEMRENEKCLPYPVIDSDKCIDCGLCVKVCQCYDKAEKDDAAKVRFFVVRQKDAEKRILSQSGGLFGGLAEVILKKGGVCYGAAVNSDLVVRQTRIDKLSELPQLLGSKYVQSDTADSFLEAEKDLKEGKTVLYSGTSCMIDGLNRYLRQKRADTENLITCDLICHGVSSPRMYKDYLGILEQQYNSKITKVDFRDKKLGWRGCVQKYTFENGNVIHDKVYTDFYFSNIAYRDSCHNCQYLNIANKVSDITMADFWGSEEANLSIDDDNTGISLATVRSDKGLKLLEESDLEKYETKEEYALVRNLNSSVPKPKWHDAFWRDYYKKGYKYCMRKYTIYGGDIVKLKRKILIKIGKW